MCMLLHAHANAEIKTSRVKTDEPVCYSRFDYDIKILRTMASLEESDAHLTEATRTLQNEVQGIKTSIEGGFLSFNLIEKNKNDNNNNDDDIDNDKHL